MITYCVALFYSPPDLADIVHRSSMMMDDDVVIIEVELFE